MEKFKTSGVCAREIHFEIEGDTVKDVMFVNGCDGNTQGVATLVKGMRVEDVIAKLKGIDCKGRGTSCPDQLAVALENHIKA